MSGSCRVLPKRKQTDAIEAQIGQSTATVAKTIWSIELCRLSMARMMKWWKAGM
jgi:hypothetical protein